jgi:hypothetical protein
VEELEEVASRTSKINDRISMLRRDVARGFRFSAKGLIGSSRPLELKAS